MKKIYHVTSDFVDTRFDRFFKRNVSNIPQSYIEKNRQKLTQFRENHQKLQYIEKIFK